MSVQERSETKNGAKREPTWHPNGSQNGSKIDPKSMIVFLIDFKAVLKPSWASLGRLLAPLNSMSEKMLVFPAHPRARARRNGAIFGSDFF